MAQQRNKLLLDLISDVKARLEGRVDSVSFPIPQFIVVGKQSVGKSTLVEGLAGETFNFVSGTLGSRRPTVLEFRNSPHPNKWYVWDDKNMSWSHHSVQEVCMIVGKAHEELGKNVSDVAVRVKVEGEDCVDLGIVDLPGFRSYAKDQAMQEFASKIDKLNQSFMVDENNVMLCVEEAGDNATFSTLNKCKTVDPTYRRTVLIRNKFDKYYGDLTAENVNRWLEGGGDLPPHLHRFALSLPHSTASDGSFPRPFGVMRTECSNRDIETIKSKGVGSSKYHKLVGFNNFQYFMQVKTQQMFADALGPMLGRLNILNQEETEKLQQIREEVELSDKDSILHATRSAGITFAQSFNYLMEGALSSEHKRMTMEQELRAFHEYCDRTGCLTQQQKTVELFGNLDAYINYLRDKAKLPGMDVELNGGAQFRRLMIEVEVFVRFAGLGQEFSAGDVIHARGLGQSWEEVIPKLLSLRGQESSQMKMREKTKYVGQRLLWFFSEQKEATVEFMETIKGSPEEHMFSKLISKKAEFIKNNATMKSAIFKAFDAACVKNMEMFESMWNDYMDAMFQSPVKLLKSCTMPSAAETAALSEEEGLAPTFDTTKERIELEMTRRSAVSSGIKDKIREIPSDDALALESRDRLQIVIEEVFGRIRSLVADQMQLYSESFFLLPMLRRLEGEMAKLDMTAEDKKRYEMIRTMKMDQDVKTTALCSDLEWCIGAVQKFKITCAP